MGILGNFDRCIHSIPQDLIEGLVFYTELSKDDYKLMESEIDTYSMNEIKFTLEEQKKVKDFGTCSILTFMGYKIIVSIDEHKESNGNFYFAFKTKIL
jgi:hypothetical protein